MINSERLPDFLRVGARQIILSQRIRRQDVNLLMLKYMLYDAGFDAVFNYHNPADIIEYGPWESTNVYSIEYDSESFTVRFFIDYEVASECTEARAIKLVETLNRRVGNTILISKSEELGLVFRTSTSWSIGKPGFRIGEFLKKASDFPECIDDFIEDNIYIM